jgi:hypothetical protein
VESSSGGGIVLLTANGLFAVVVSPLLEFVETRVLDLADGEN